MDDPPETTIQPDQAYNINDFHQDLVNTFNEDENVNEIYISTDVKIDLSKWVHDKFNVKTFLLSDSYIYTSSIAIVLSFLIAFFMQYQKKSNQNKIINNIRPKLIKQIADKIDAENKSFLKQLENDKDQQMDKISENTETEGDNDSNPDKILADLKKQLITLESNITSVTDQSNKLREESDKNKATIANVQNDLNNLYCDRKIILEDESSIDHEISELNSKCGSTTELLKKLKTDQKSKLDKKANVLAENKNKICKIEVENKRLDYLKSQYNQENVKITPLEETLSKLKAATDDKIKQLDQEKQKFLKLNKAYNKLEHVSSKKEKLSNLINCSQLDDELESNKERLNSLKYIQESNESDFTSINDKLVVLELKSLSLEKEKQALTKSVNKITTSLKVANDFYKERDLKFQTMIGTEKLENESTAHELDNLTKDEKLTNEQILEYKSENLRLKKELDSLEREKRDNVHKFELKTYKNDIACKDAQQKLKIAENAIEQLKFQMEHLEQELIQTRNAANLGAPKFEHDFDNLSNEDEDELKPPTPPERAMSANLMMPNFMSQLGPEYQNMLINQMNRAPSLPSVNMMNFNNMGMSPVMNGKGERPNSEGIGMNNIPSFPYKPMPFDYSAPMMNNTNPYSSNQVFNSYSPMNSPKSGKDYGAKGDGNKNITNTQN